MSFLQPLLLAALPLVALPIIIHLINQRRFQTIRWAAMMFLLAANRMSRGYARLRQWLILLFRMLAVAGLIFAVSRPLASGWLGLTAGGRPDTTLILLDRSPSMSEHGPGTVTSKLDTGRRQLARALSTLGSTRWVLIDGATNQPRELESPDQLATLPATELTSASADLPALLQAALDYLAANKAGSTEIWICSDLRQHDWNPGSGRWRSLRDRFRELPQGVRFHLLTYPQPAPGNVAVRVTDVRREQTATEAAVLVSLWLTRDDSAAPQTSIPIQFEIEGARSELTVDMSGSQHELLNHRIPIDRRQERGWGRVSIPQDGNPADNEFYFVFDQPQPRRTVIVADDPLAARGLQLAAAISPEPNLTVSADVVTTEDLPTMDWDSVALLLWQAPLPVGAAAEPVQTFVARGGQVVFFPPQSPASDHFAGVAWRDWSESREGMAVETWRGDQDLLGNTRSGAALPVGELEIRRYCALAGEHTPLATLRGGAPLLARVSTNRGGVYFCATTPAPGDSSLADNGVVLYVLIQRALAAGAAELGTTRALVAGDVGGEPTEDWRRRAGPVEALSTEYAFHAGVYATGDRLLALNRAAAEDDPAVVADARLDELFQGLDYVRVDDRAGSLAALIQEIWRVFLAAMMIALVVEAALCLPRVAPAAPAPAGAAP